MEINKFLLTLHSSLIFGNHCFTRHACISQKESNFIDVHFWRIVISIIYSNHSSGLKSSPFSRIEDSGFTQINNEPVTFRPRENHGGELPGFMTWRPTGRSTMKKDFGGHTHITVGFVVLLLLLLLFLPLLLIMYISCE